MSTRFSDLRADMVPIVEAALAGLGFDGTGIKCEPAFTGNGEAHHAYLRWGGAGAGWLTRDPGDVFSAPKVALSVIVTAQGIDWPQAQLDLEAAAAALWVGVGGQTLASGGRCPPVVAVSEPGDLFENPQLLAIEAQLAPVPLSLI